MTSSRENMAEVVIVRECKHGQVRVVFGNITTIKGDIMVIPANNRLAGREGLDERMQLAAGPELREFCTNIAKFTTMWSWRGCFITRI
jgi:O-acetyl-ADP-ribose deacetylase (regulator of RNase III)